MTRFLTLIGIGGSRNHTFSRSRVGPLVRDPGFVAFGQRDRPYRPAVSRIDYPGNDTFGYARRPASIQSFLTADAFNTPSTPDTGSGGTTTIPSTTYPGWGSISISVTNIPAASQSSAGSTTAPPLAQQACAEFDYAALGFNRTALAEPDHLQTWRLKLDQTGLLTASSDSENGDDPTGFLLLPSDPECMGTDALDDIEAFMKGEGFDLFQRDDFVNYDEDSGAGLNFMFEEWVWPGYYYIVLYNDSDSEVLPGLNLSLGERTDLDDADTDSERRRCGRLGRRNDRRYIRRHIRHDRWRLRSYRRRYG